MGKKIAIQLECLNEDEALSYDRVRICVLLEEDGSIAGVAGPFACSPPLYRDIQEARARGLEEVLAGELEEALAEIYGFREVDFVAGPVIQVSAETMDMYVRNWGRNSREGILRVARTQRSDREVPLSVEATEACFDKAGDREFAAALWFLLRAGERFDVTLCEFGERYPGNEVCQIGPFVLCVDDEGFVTVDEFPSVAAASVHIDEVKAKGPLPTKEGPARLSYLLMDSGGASDGA